MEKDCSNILNSSTYDHLEKYKCICNEIQKQLAMEEYKNIIYKYRNDPAKWIEDYLDIKLKAYQKILVKQMWDNKKKINPTNYSRKTQCHGLDYANIILDEMERIGLC